MIHVLLPGMILRMSLTVLWSRWKTLMPCRLVPHISFADAVAVGDILYTHVEPH